jgi:hypothetical protein
VSQDSDNSPAGSGNAPGEPWAPVVIGATGGSGTRAVHGVLQELGLFMGVRLNGAGDAMDMEPFLDRWINPLIASHNRLDYAWNDLGWYLRWRSRSALKRGLQAFLRERPTGQPWGWKNPRAMYVLPVIAATVPGVRFLHVVRDGRDMAFSENQNQRRKHYEALFGAQGDERDTPAGSASLWATANAQAADWAERELGPARYHQLKLEELCGQPVATVTRLVEWLALPRQATEADIARAAATISTPASLGRWRQQPQAEVAAVTAAAAAALRRFSYI